MMARLRRQLGHLDGVYRRLADVAERDLVPFDGPAMSADPVLRMLCRLDSGNPAGQLLSQVDAGQPIEVTGADLAAVSDETHVDAATLYLVSADDSVIRAGRPPAPLAERER